MALKDRLEAVVDGMPAGASVSLPVGWLRQLLEAEPEGSDVPSLLDLEEAAGIVGRAVSTVRTWCNSGELEGAFKLRGHAWRIPVEALDRFLEAQGEEPEQAPQSGPVDLGSWRKVRERES